MPAEWKHAHINLARDIWLGFSDALAGIGGSEWRQGAPEKTGPCCWCSEALSFLCWDGARSSHERAKRGSERWGRAPTSRSGGLSFIQSVFDKTNVETAESVRGNAAESRQPLFVIVSSVRNSCTHPPHPDPLPIGWGEVGRASTSVALYS
jgi:hypothetical protein